MPWLSRHLQRRTFRLLSLLSHETLIQSIRIINQAFAQKRTFLCDGYGLNRSNETPILPGWTLLLQLIQDRTVELVYDTSQTQDSPPSMRRAAGEIE